jgi:micrococcal nuclease
VGIFRQKQRRGFLIPAIVLFALLVVSYRLVEQTGHDKRVGDRFTVTRVLDGDTAELTGGDRLRLLGIDTPEAGERFHDEAKALLVTLSLDQPCRIEHGGARRDKYGRMLGYLYVDTVFVNRTIVAAGLAYVYLFKDSDLKQPEIRELIDAQKTAIAERRGLWSLPREKESYYVNTVGSFRLHRPNCSAIGPLRAGRHRTYATREEGLSEGLSPCRTCKP